MWRNVSVLEGVLGAASHKPQYGMTVGRCKYSWGPGGETPGSSEDTSFYSTKNGPKIDAFLPGYCIVVEIIRIGRQKISQKITFIFYTNEGVRNP